MSETKFCYCGPRECCHPSTLRQGFTCRVQSDAARALEAERDRWQGRVTSLGEQLGTVLAQRNSAEAKLARIIVMIEQARHLTVDALAECGDRREMILEELEVALKDETS